MIGRPAKENVPCFGRIILKFDPADEKRICTFQCRPFALQKTDDLFQCVFRHKVVAVGIAPVVLPAILKRDHRALVGGVAEGDAGVYLEVFRQAQKLSRLTAVQGADDAAADALCPGRRGHARHGNANVNIAVAGD